MSAVRSKRTFLTYLPFALTPSCCISITLPYGFSIHIRLLGFFGSANEWRSIIAIIHKKMGIVAIR